MTERPNNPQDTQEGKQRLLQAYEIYNSLANGKLESFREVKEYLSITLEQLLAEGKIGPGVILSSRIKSPESVLQNWRLKKNLYDIFGIALITTTEQEMNEIRARLRKDKKFNISSRKKMNEKRGYEAIHFLFNVEENDGHKTMVECHMQTHEAYKNVYPHVFYKARKKLRRDLTKQEEQAITQKIQTMYHSKEIFGVRLANGRSSRVPQMWVSSFNQQGKMEEQELDEEMILTIMYPFLSIAKPIREKTEKDDRE